MGFRLSEHLNCSDAADAVKMFHNEFQEAEGGGGGTRYGDQIKCQSLYIKNQTDKPLYYGFYCYYRYFVIVFFMVLCNEEY